MRYSGSEGIHPRLIDLLRQVKDAVTESLHTSSHVAHEAPAELYGANSDRKFCMTLWSLC